MAAAKKNSLEFAKDWFLSPDPAIPQKARMTALFEKSRITRAADLPELLNARDVASHLKMNPKTASALMKKGIIRSMKMRGRRFTTPEWLAEYMRKEIGAHG
jgi:hypothetical protein